MPCLVLHFCISYAEVGRYKTRTFHHFDMPCPAAASLQRVAFQHPAAAASLQLVAFDISVPTF